MTLLFLTWSRWGDAWSVDAWLRRDRPTRSVAPQEYGYTVWMPSLILGVVFLASAEVKLEESGLAWIYNGTVKYHFLSDSPDAVVDWGLRLGSLPWLAVFLSFSRHSDRGRGYLWHLFALVPIPLGRGMCGTLSFSVSSCSTVFSGPCG